jgi:hypothetical protein
MLQRCDGAVHGRRVRARCDMSVPLQQEARFEAAAACSGFGARERALFRLMGLFLHELFNCRRTPPFGPFFVP